MTHYVIHPVVYIGDDDAEIITDPNDQRDADAYGIYAKLPNGEEELVGDDVDMICDALEAIAEYDDVESVTLSSIALKHLVSDLNPF